jgi:hypothetical protein
MLSGSSIADSDENSARDVASDTAAKNDRSEREWSFLVWNSPRAWFDEVSL